MSKISELAARPRPTDPKAEAEWLDAQFSMYLSALLQQRFDASSAKTPPTTRRTKGRAA
jgi:hypothetical protein